MAQMNYKFFKSVSFFVLLMFSFGFTFTVEEARADFNVCIAQFPCHLKTGKLLPGFDVNTPCGWENICNNYRNSKEFKEAKKRLALIKKQNKRMKA
jgi:hypothetical protein